MSPFLAEKGADSILRRRFPAAPAPPPAAVVAEGRRWEVEFDLSTGAALGFQLKMLEHGALLEVPRWH